MAGSNGIVSSLRAVVSSLMPRSATAAERDAVEQMCVMVLIPCGDEDPKGLLSALSDETLSHAVGALGRAGGNPAVDGVKQFLLVEWASRTGSVDEWDWKWENQSEGRISYRSVKAAALTDLAHCGTCLA